MSPFADSQTLAGGRIYISVRGHFVLKKPMPDFAIRVGGGRYTIVDEEDYHRLRRFTWSTHTKEKKPYVYRVESTQKSSRIPGGSLLQPEGKVKRHHMSRVILNAPDHLQVDHINGDTLDNRRCNLRLATASQNAQNKGLTSNNTTGYKGLVRVGKRFEVAITANKKTFYLGSYKSARWAAKAYDRAAKKLHGEFAKLNFPE